MPAAKSIVLPFQTGVDQKTHKAWLQPGTNTSVVNGVWRKAGAISKRFGYTALATNYLLNGVSTALPGGSRLLSRGEELSMTDGYNLYSYSDVEPAWYWKDLVSECVATWDPIAGATTSTLNTVHITFLDACLIGASLSQLVVVFIGDVVGAGYQVPNWLVIDTDTGGTIVPPQPIPGLNAATNYTGTKIIQTTISGANAAIVTFVSGTVIHATQIIPGNTGPQAATFPVTLVTDMGASAGGGAYDISNIPGASPAQFVVAYEDTTDSVNRAAWNIWKSDLTASVASGRLADNHPGHLAYAVAAYSSSLIWINFVDGTGTCYTARVSGSTILSSPVNVYTPAPTTNLTQLGALPLSSTVQILASGGLATAQVMNWQQLQVSGATTATVGPLRRAPNCYLLSKPVVYGGHTYVEVANSDTSGANSSNLQPTVYLADLTTSDTSADELTLRPVATVAPRANAGLFGATMGWGACHNLIESTGSILYSIAALAQGAPASLGQTPPTGLWLVNYNFAFGNAWQSAEINGTTFLAGGMPCFYDGAHVLEAGFLWYPQILAGTPGAASSGSMGAGTYSYQAVYEWYDAAGNRHQSAPSQPFTVSGVQANGSVAIETRSINLTRREIEIITGDVGNTLSVVLYRTQQGPSQTYYKLSASLSSTNDTFNVGGFTSFTDLAPDSSIASNEVLYTTGGAVPNTCPPSFTCVITHKNRLFGVAGDGRTIWYTKAAVPGTAPAFYDGFTMMLMEGGRITGLASMDDYLVIFQRDRIYFVTGDGALDTGDGSQLSLPPIRIPSDVGCVEPRSILVTPQGTFFQSAIGICLLARDRTVSYVGRAIEDQLSNRTIVSASFVPYTNEIRFIAQGLSTIVLVYNYLFGAWSWWVIQNERSGGDALVSSLTVNGAYYLLCLDGGTFEENTTGATNSSTDSGTYVPLTVESAWLNAGQVTGYQRIRLAQLLVDSLDACDITIAFARDYGAYTDTHLFSAGTIGGGGGGPLQLEAHVGAMLTKSEAIRVKISDAPPTGGPTILSGAGPTLVSLNVELQAFGRRMRQLPATQKG